MSPVIDASAMLAVVLGESGDAFVLSSLRYSAISAVNLSECFSRAVERGTAAAAVEQLLNRLEVDVVAFTASHARVAADLREPSRHLGLSLADRACLALARDRGSVLLTGDRRLAGFVSDIDIRLIR